MHEEFLETRQRPFPIPDGPWLVTQTWNNLLFSHWPIPSKIIKEHLPSSLEVDLFDGQAWVGIIPFYVNHMRIRGLPSIPYFHAYVELNVRTYVTYKGTPGIYFFSLDANKWMHVIGAKIGAFLPYRYASMDMKEENHIIHFYSRRKHTKSEGEQLKLTYQSSSEIYLPNPDSLEYWLFERYCFFTSRGNYLYRGDIHHDRWRVSDAKVMIHANSMASFLPHKYIESQPLVHFSRKKQVFAWALKRLQ